jgi:hypothetical protein
MHTSVAPDADVLLAAMPSPPDRLSWMLLANALAEWRTALMVVQPETGIDAAIRERLELVRLTARPIWPKV